MPQNELYLCVLPIVHIGSGLVEQTLTLFPSRDFATEFFEDEVQGYILRFEGRANKYLVGGHVVNYELHPEPATPGRVIVRVIQNVA